MRIDDYIKKFYKKNSEKEHAYEVTKFSQQIFDFIIKNTEFSYLKNCEKPLKVASLLHDIGINIDDGTHHARRGAEFVLNHGVAGSDEDELKIIFCLIRYHRGKKPKKKHEIYGDLLKEKRKIIKILTSILQVADLLDFGHLSYVENIKISAENSKFIIKTNPEISKLVGFKEAKAKKTELFEKVFNIELIIV